MVTCGDRQAALTENTELDDGSSNGGRKMRAGGKKMRARQKWKGARVNNLSDNGDI